MMVIYSLCTGAFLCRASSMEEKYISVHNGISQKLFSADYYPVIPWGFLFLSGAMGGYVLKSKKLPGFLYNNFADRLLLSEDIP